MATRMLIDARHSEETRVAVLKGNRIEEFDFESADHRQIKGNIYLAKVTRVEPSLQAAFVDFGGNRHGFLAFNEIHPDYYQIPKEDREALLAAEAEVAEEEERLRDEEEARGELPGDEYDADEESSGALAEDLAEDGLEEVDTSDKDSVSTIEEGQLDSDDDSDEDETEDEGEDASDGNNGQRQRRGRGRRQGKGRGNRSRAKEVDEARAKRMAIRRRYKIQDVIQRRQVLLVQVVKEERGNKGAALTTYLSLAGRYTVLMPNSSHGGGISRKINSAGDRKRLKQIVSDLNLPKSMGLIVRTAGLSRTKTEIKRDFDYLARLWDEIRERTLSSSAPSLIHSDSDLIKRAIRDIYNREIEEVMVEGEDGYKSAKAFMKLLMPSHARRVKAYSDPVPLFQRFGAEDQLRALYDPMVQLKSGGYLIINPTEALVSIDINSGRSTKEHGIEQTALHTNLEAAREIARQLRLRDMAGLVVIDFIDMDYHSNVRKVERAMKDALKNDRARIQVGRISSFGLMEMSRQRLRTGVLEATTRECPHCDGTGLVRTASSAGLSALRLIEDEAAKGKGSTIQLAASTEAAVYLLNEKRRDLMEIEQRYGVAVEVVPEGEDEGAKMSVTSSGPKPKSVPRFEPVIDDDEEEEELPEIDDNENEDEEDEGDRKKRRRRRGGRNRKKKDRGENADDSDDSADTEDETSESDGSDDDSDENGNGRKRRRRGRRGGRGRRKDVDNGAQGEEVTEDKANNLAEVSEHIVDDMAVVAGPEDAPETAEAASDEQASERAEDKPKPKRTRRKKADSGQPDSSETASTDAPESDASQTDAEAKPKPKRTRRKKAETEPTSEAQESDPPKVRKPRSRAKPKVAEQDGEAALEAGAADNLEAVSDRVEADTAGVAPSEADTDAGASSGESAPAPTGTPRKGWWQRTFGD